MNNKFKISRVLAMASKEMDHILRDPFIIGLALGLPIVMVIFFGFAIDFNIRNIKLSALDADKSRMSREMLRTFSSSGYFSVKNESSDVNPINEVESERSSLALVIPPGFSRDVTNGAGGRVQLLLDGSDNMKSGVILSYLTGIQARIREQLSSDFQIQPVELRSRFLY
ncbi:MAG: ABC transporter permease, partial [bacterium]|nr:ABC transporter permease [bacterium]